MTAFTSPDHPPSRFSPAFLIAWVMAAAVLVLELLIPALGIYALVHLGVRVGSVLIAAFCFFIFWVTRPRLTARGIRMSGMRFLGCAPSWYLRRRHER